MDIYSKYLEEASRTFKIADHMLFVTYPLVKDTKLLLAILENLFITLDNSIAALVHNERFYKEIPPFQDNFSSRLNAFSMRCIPKYNISNDKLQLIRNIQTLIEEHKKSPVEFISINNLKEYLTETKSFMTEIKTILDKNSEELR